MPAFNSAVQICNYALGRIGHNSIITSLSESSTAATQCNLVYDRVRLSTIESHDWAFLRKHALLTQSGLTPPVYWDYAYQYPGDAQKLIALYDVNWERQSDQRRMDYEIGVQTSTGLTYRLIYSNLKTAYLRYTIDSEEPEIWPQYFVDAIFVAIAAEICLSMTGSQSMTMELQQAALVAMDRARAQDNEQGADSVDWYTAAPIEARD